MGESGTLLTMINGDVFCKTVSEEKNLDEDVVKTKFIMVFTNGIKNKIPDLISMIEFERVIDEEVKKENCFKITNTRSYRQNNRRTV